MTVTADTGTELDSQTCTTQSRILAPRSRYDEVVDALAGWTSQQVIGNPLDLGAPFGGMKDSGIGRELGPEAINPYLQYKLIYASANQIKK